MSRFAAVCMHICTLWGMLFGVAAMKASGGDPLRIAAWVAGYMLAAAALTWLQWPGLRSADERLAQRLSDRRGSPCA